MAFLHDTFDVRHHPLFSFSAGGAIRAWGSRRAAAVDPSVLEDVYADKVVEDILRWRTGAKTARRISTRGSARHDAVVHADLVSGSCLNQAIGNGTYAGH